ncbi:hypothetical protein ACFCWV_00145 [Streptomyces sp. NPDC056341]|uniref:hypothetical protein n=1 Tax=Streptomyces sp. NPDC056341 TaxID=3345788 RepID=UPI0035D542F4
MGADARVPTTARNTEEASISVTASGSRTVVEGTSRERERRRSQARLDLRERETFLRRQMRVASALLSFTKTEDGSV